MKYRIGLTITVSTMCMLTTIRLNAAACVNVNDPRTVAWVNTFITSALGSDVACRGGAPDRDSFASDNACNIFVGRVMARMYGLNTLVGGDGAFLQANDIAVQIPTWDGWNDLGLAGDQTVLDTAAAAANDGALVMAVWVNPTPGKHAMLH